MRKTTSLVGRTCRFLFDMKTNGGVKFDAGEEATIIKVFKGLSLRTDDGRAIIRVPKFHVQVIEEESAE